nr:hypothetical protein [Streptomyces hygroscopicus]
MRSQEPPAGGSAMRKPGLTWSEHDEELLRRRKPWYYGGAR